MTAPLSISDRNTGRSRVTSVDLKSGFVRLGLRPDDTVLVHSSLSRFGYVEGGVDGVIDSLLETLGPQGTLMMSAITTNVKFVTTCIAAADDGVVAPVAPFDVAATSTYAGTIAETFRHRPGVKRSWHPTHSVTALGPRADELLANHETAPGPCGEGTPYTRLCALDRGFVLLLGVSHMANTATHGFEELAQVEYVLYPKWVRVPLITPAGKAEAHTRVHNAFMQRNLNIFETDYIDAQAETVTHIGDSVVRLANAKKMCEITFAALQKDPLKMLTDRGRRAWALMKATGNFTRDPLAAMPA